MIGEDIKGARPKGIQQVLLIRLIGLALGINVTESLESLPVLFGKKL